jgi:hypothetical protein
MVRFVSGFLVFEYVVPRKILTSSCVFLAGDCRIDCGTYPFSELLCLRGQQLSSWRKVGAMYISPVVICHH